MNNTNTRKRTASTASNNSSIPEEIDSIGNTSNNSSIPEEIGSIGNDPDPDFTERTGRITPPGEQERYNKYVKSFKPKPHISEARKLNGEKWNGLKLNGEKWYGPMARSLVERLDDRKSYMDAGIEIYNKAAEENNGEKMEIKKHYLFDDIARLHAGLALYYSGLENVQSREAASIQERLKKRKVAGRKTNKRKALKKKVKKTKRKSLKKRRKTKRRKN